MCDDASASSYWWIIEIDSNGIWQCIRAWVTITITNTNDYSQLCLRIM
jgi:hypothetical protein